MTDSAQAAPRPRSTRWVWVSGVALLLASVLTLMALVVTHVGGYPHWSEESAVPVDGRPHPVAVDDGRALMIWTYTNDGAPTCTAHDEAGSELPTEAPDDAYRRGGGAGDWVGTTVVRPTSDSLEVTCSGLHPSANSSVQVESVPRLPAALAGDGPLAAIALGLAGAGALTLLAAALLAVRRRLLAVRR